MKFKKLKTFVFILSLVWGVLPCLGRDSINKNKFEFSNCNNPKHRRYVKKGNTIELFLKKQKNSAIFYVGKLLNITDSSLILKVSFIEYARFSSDKSGDIIAVSDYSLNDSTITFKLKDIDYIKIHTVFIDYFLGITGLTAFAAALLVAPAASIEYNERGFNKERYFNILYPSLAIGTVFVPFDLLIKKIVDKKYTP